MTRSRPILFRAVTSLAVRSRHLSHRIGAMLMARIAGGALEWPPSAHAVVPVRVDGSGRVAIGARLALGFSLAPRVGSGEILLQARTSNALIEIGADTTLSNGVSIIALDSVSIGRDCRIGDSVAIYDSDFHELSPATRNRSAGEVRPVTIGDNVWLGSRVMVLKGVTIGNNSVVAAGAVVAQCIPANVLAGGVPAKVIRGL